MFTAFFWWCVLWFCLSEMAFFMAIRLDLLVFADVWRSPLPGPLVTSSEALLPGSPAPTPMVMVEIPGFLFHGDDMAMVMVYEWLWNWVYHRTIYFVNLCYTLFGASNIHRPAIFLLCENQGSCISLTKIGACAHVRCKRYELRSGALWWENDGNHGGQYGLMRFNRDILCIIYRIINTLTCQCVWKLGIPPVMAIE